VNENVKRFLHLCSFLLLLNHRQWASSSIHG